MDAPSAQRQFLVKVDGIPGNFMTKSGGNISADTTKVFDGGSLTPEVIPGPAQADDVTCGRAFKRDRDQPVLTDLRQRVGRFRATVSVTPTDIDMVVNGDPVVYSDALLTGLNEFDVDSGSGDAASFELVFAVGAFR